MVWKPGQSGNPRGRPSRSVASELRRKLDPGIVADRIVEILTNDGPILDQATLRWAAQFYTERVDGKVPDKHEFGRAGDFDFDGLPPALQARLQSLREQELALIDEWLRETSQLEVPPSEQHLIDGKVQDEE